MCVMRFLCIYMHKYIYAYMFVSILFEVACSRWFDILALSYIYIDYIGIGVSKHLIFYFLLFRYYSCVVMSL